MKIEFDETKRQWTLENRELDFRDAPLVFAGDYVELLDDKKDYGEARYLVYGMLDDRNVSIVWTPREDRKRIISMRYVHDKEAKIYRRSLD